MCTNLAGVFRALIFLSVVTFLVGCGGGGGGDGSLHSEQDGQGTATPISNDSNDSISSVIGPSGGSLITPSGEASLNVPAGALNSDVFINISLCTADIPTGSLDSVYDFTPSGQTFTNPVTISIKYDPNTLPKGTNPADLTLAYLSSDGTWVDVADATVDTTNHTISCQTTHFSPWTNKFRTTSIPRHGDPIGEFNSIVAYSNGSWDYNDKHAQNYNYYNGVKTGLEWECVEFINRYYLQYYGENIRGNGGDAKDYYSSAEDRGLLAYQNDGTVPPRVGDILVSERGYYGHVAIVREVYADMIVVIQQNWFQGYGDNEAILLREGNHIYPFGGSKKGSYEVKGWLRIKSWTALSGRSSHVLAIRSDRSLWAWGRNQDGELGDGTYTSRTLPTQIGTDTDWAFVSVGATHSVAIKTDGTLWAWGSNSSGQLGDGTYIDKNVPVQIGSDTDWASFSAGASHNMAIKTDGSLWAWGSNVYGQLGDGTYIDKNVPVQIGSDTDWAVISPGCYHTVAMKTDGTLWAWGNNTYGQLGDGTYINKNVPVQIGSDTDWAMISAGYTHNVAIKTDGTLWAWGSNSSGQLGDGTYIDKNVPVQIGSDTDWASFSAGAHHNMAIKTDGTLWAWGDNSAGDWYGGWLGDGTDIDRNVPVQIGTDNNWTILAPGRTHSAALKTDGSFWAWGHNHFGELGDGTTSDKYTPTKVYIP